MVSLENLIKELIWPYLITPKALPRYVRRYARAFSWKRLVNFFAVLASHGAVVDDPPAHRVGASFYAHGRADQFLQPQVPPCAPSGNGQMRRPSGHDGLGGLQKAG